MLDQRFCIFCFLFERGREGNFALQNVLVDPHCIIVAERVDSSMHFIDQHSQGPPINCFPMALIENNFRSNVFWRSTNGKCSPFVEDLGKTEISEL